MTDKILVVDDDLNGLKLLSLTLQAEGFEVLAANSGPQGLRRIEAEKPDLAILDVMMPGMTGLEVCQAIRQSDHAADLPVIMLTARSDVDDRVSGLRVGADDYIPKPASPAEVVARVRAVLTRARRHYKQMAKTISFLGATAGVGTSTIAANVAVAMSDSGRGVALVEFKSSPGTLGLQMGLVSRRHLGTLLSMPANEITAREVDHCMTRYRGGLRILTSPHDASQFQGISSEQAQRILDGARHATDFLLIDLPIHSSPERDEVLNRSDLMLMIVEPEPSSVACARLALASLDSLSSGGSLMGMVIVNRSATTTPLTLPEMQEVLPLDIFAVIPLSSDAFVSAHQAGIPLVLVDPDNLAALALKELAERLGRWHVNHRQR